MTRDEKVALIKKAVTMQMYFDKLVIPAMPDYYSSVTVDFEADRRTLCPLHDENTPSFRWYPEDNSYYCYGCGKGGDVIYLHTMFMEILTGKKPLFSDAVDEMYKFFIEGREQEVNKRLKENSDSLFEEEPLSTNVELVRYGRKVQEIEDREIRNRKLSLSDLTELYSLIDKYNMLVSLNKMNATEAGIKITETYDRLLRTTKKETVKIKAVTI